MACHIMDPIYWTLELKYPTKVNGSSTLSNLYSPPHAQKVHYTFPARPAKEKVNMPEVKVVWYDGGLLPEHPTELAPSKMMGNPNGGIIFIGTKGKITELNATEAAREWINHTYHNGFTLPPMPAD